MIIQRLCFYLGRHVTAVWRYSEARDYAKGRVLDIGCGRGSLSLALRGCDYTGVDRTNSFHNMSGYTFIQADVTTVQRNVVAGPFDSILALAFIEHIIDAEDVLLWCYRLLKPGGRLVISTPTKWGDRLVRVLFEKGQDHVHIYNKQELEGLLHKTGFALDRFSYFEGRLNQLVVASKKGE